MNDKITILLLHVIHLKKNVNQLLHHNLSYREIVKLVETNIDEGNIVDDGGRVMLTEKGLEILKQNESKIKERDKTKWIEPDHANKIRKIGPDEVFLPSQHALSFLK